METPAEYVMAQTGIRCNAVVERFTPIPVPDVIECARASARCAGQILVTYKETMFSSLDRYYTLPPRAWCPVCGKLYDMEWVEREREFRAEMDKVNKIPINKEG